MGGTRACIAFPRSGTLAGAGGTLSKPRGARGGALLAFGAVGIEVPETLGETLKALLRGPDGAVGGGGGVFGREKAGGPATLEFSLCGGTNGIRGEGAG